MLAFESANDVLDVLPDPVVGDLVALVWLRVQALDKRRRFERLIALELEEVKPYPKTRSLPSTVWAAHQNKTILFKRIPQDATANRGFILSLVGQLLPSCPH